MASDPGFASDTCIFMEAAPGDGGVHDGNGVWWLSPDLSLVGPTSGLDQADAGQVNKIRVKVRRKPVASNCTFPGAESITVETWVANPSLAMAPFNANSTRRVGFIGSPVPAEGGSAAQQVEWQPRSGLPRTDPEAAGQKCLVARAYPDNLTPSAIQFFVPGDQHVVQHNLCVVSCPGNTQRPCSFNISTVNPLARASVLKIKVKAVFDANPSEFVRTAVFKRLNSTPGLHPLATHPPPSFGFDFSSVPIAGLIPQPTVPPITTPTSTESQLHLAGQLITFQFFAKLKGPAGSAYIFHITQTGVDNSPQGGLTLVMLAA